MCSVRQRIVIHLQLEPKPTGPEWKTKWAYATPINRNTCTQYWAVLTQTHGLWAGSWITTVKVEFGIWNHKENKPNGNHKSQAKYKKKTSGTPSLSEWGASEGGEYMIYTDKKYTEIW